MRAATIVDGRIEVGDHPDPVPGTGEVLVRVRAAGLNAADLLQVRGLYPAPPGSPADIPGLEAAGEVVDLGPGVTGLTVGDRVMSILGGGGQGELVVMPAATVMAVPGAMGWDEAGGFPEAFVTAHDSLFGQCELTVGERVCVHGGAGGVGTAAVQLAVAAGARVVATVRRPERRADVERLGATAVAPEEFGDHGPFDVILELVGAPNMEANLAALATGGRIGVIGVGAGASATVNLLALMQRRGRIHGSTLRARSVAEKAAATQRVIRQVLPLVEAGRITVPVVETFILERVGAAYDGFAAGGKFGKLVIRPNG